MLRHGYEAFTKHKSPEAAMPHSHGDQVMLTSCPNLTFKAQEEPQHTQQLQCRPSLPLSSLLIKEKTQETQRKENPNILALLVIRWQ